MCEIDRGMMDAAGLEVDEGGVTPISGNDDVSRTRISLGEDGVIPACELGEQLDLGQRLRAEHPVVQQLSESRRPTPWQPRRGRTACGQRPRIGLPDELSEGRHIGPAHRRPQSASPRPSGLHSGIRIRSGQHIGQGRHLAEIGHDDDPEIQVGGQHPWRPGDRRQSSPFPHDPETAGVVGHGLGSKTLGNDGVGSLAGHGGTVHPAPSDAGAHPVAQDLVKGQLRAQDERGVVEPAQSHLHLLATAAINTVVGYVYSGRVHIRVIPERTLTTTLHSHNTDTGNPGPARRVVTVPASIPMVTLVGPNDEFLKHLEDALGADILVRGNEIHLAGHPADLADANDILTEMTTIIRTGQGLSADDVDRIVAMTRNGEGPAEIMTADILSSRGKTVRPKTLNQKRYVDAIDAHTVTFGIGPAGTGKTYLAMAKAVQALQTKQVSRIILTRPAVEAGEKIGFLPGTLSEKIDPYLRPLYDALRDMVDPDSIPRLIGAGTVEVAPLAYMRGRTLNDAFVILDEAQNTSPQQMKMFLTRLGFGSKIVVTGDITQVDLPGGVKSGLRVVQGILDGIDDIAFCNLTSRDVVRHRLVGKIVAAYDRYDTVAESYGPRNPRKNRKTR